VFEEGLLSEEPPAWSRRWTEYRNMNDKPERDFRQQEEVGMGFPLTS
jgi:hypothetical protein